MNELVDKYFQTLLGKKVAVLGIGVSNRPLIQMLLSYGIETVACDKMERSDLDEDVLRLEKAGAILRLGAGYLDDLCADVVFRTPGMHPDIPALRKLRKCGALITSEMEVFFSVCPCPIIAVTGSDGKTTTTTLIAKMLEHANYKVWLGGNIGQPLLPSASQMSSSDFAVVELSSFQLMNMKQSAHIAVITNIAPNHLDVHKDMDEYIAAKENIYLWQDISAKLVLNRDNAITNGFADKAHGEVMYFSRKEKMSHGAYALDGKIYLNGAYVMDEKDILIPGLHNVENYLAAMAAVSDYVTAATVRHVAGSFGGVEHRIELVRELDGVKYYNDSIASSPTRTIAGLRAFSSKVILIAGGYDKQIPFDELGVQITKHVKRLILCGITADKIQTAVRNAPDYVEGKPDIIVVDSLKEAVKDAHAHAQSGDIVTLSPACAAFDQFKNFMVRGAEYKKLVHAL